MKPKKSYRGGKIKRNHKARKIAKDERRKEQKLIQENYGISRVKN